MTILFDRKLSHKALERALACARGSYQRDLLLGHQAWSGSDLTGKARRYSTHYYQSRQSVAKRLIEAGFRLDDHYIKIDGRNRRFLIVYEPKNGLPRYADRRAVVAPIYWAHTERLYTRLSDLV